MATAVKTPVHEYHVTYSDGTTKTITTEKHHSRYSDLKQWVKDNPILSAGIGAGVGVVLEKIRHIRTY